MKNGCLLRARLLTILVLVVGIILPARSQTVTTAVVDIGNGGDTGSYTSQATVQGTPAIAYYNASDGRLMFARNSNASGSGAWTISAVDSVGDVGKYPSLAIIVGSSRVDLQACKLEYSIVSPK